MTIPDYQSLMLPVLREAEGGEVRVSDVVDRLADTLALSPEERSELLPSGRQTLFANRVHWAKTYLTKAGLLETTRRAYFRITDRGRSALQSYPDRIDNKVLAQFPEFQAFTAPRPADGSGRAFNDNPARPTQQTEPATSSATPDEVMRAAYGRINAALGEELIERVLAAPPEFFERLIISLLLAMGYGGSAAEAGRALGRSGDDGVDGVVDQDPLGLDRVYIQAKRYRPDNKIGPAAVRDFFGSLDMFKAAKGLFVTTSSFSSSASQTADMLGKWIVLIDGQQLAQLMIRYNVGCRVEETLQIRKLDESFFE